MQKEGDTLLITLNQLKTSLQAMKNYVLQHIPTNVSQLTNDAGYLTQHQDISGKANISDLATVATSGDYDDLSNKPTIPTNVSELNNDVGYLTQHQDISGKANSADLATVATSGDYDDLSNKPSIPTNVSELNNDVGYLTQHQDISGKANVSDLAVVATSGSYNDLSNKPTIPTAVSELTNDSNFTTKTYVDGEIDDLQTTISTKADMDGSYDSMAVKESERLASLEFTEDNTPYLFRKSGGDGNEEPVIVGGSVVWNQLVQNGNFADGTTGWQASGSSISISTADNVLTVTANGTPGQYSGAYKNGSPFSTAPSGHKMLISVDINCLHGTPTFGITNSTPASSGTSVLNNGYYSCKRIVSLTASTPHQLQIYFGTGYASYVSGEEMKVKNVNVYDLTTMLPTAIADYVYALEQATAGSGIAWLKKYGFFTKDYYPYSEPTFKHVEGLVSHRMVGFNQLSDDAISALTGITKSGDWWVGLAASWNNRTEVKGWENIEFISGMSYCASAIIDVPSTVTMCRLQIFYTDGTKTNGTSVTSGNVGKSVVVSDASKTISYVNLTFGSGGSNNIKVKDFCINLHCDGSRDGEYERYKEYTYPLDSNVILRGFPKLDASNNLYFDGDVYRADGTVTRKYGIVDLGTLTWSYESVNQRFNAYGVPSINASETNLKCPIYTVGATATENMTMQVTASKALYIKNETYSQAATFKTAMSGVYLLYPLATPTTETADTFQSPQVVDSFGTEEWVFDDNAFPVPVGHETTYRNIVTMQDVKNIQTDIDNIQFDLSNKQDTLTFDSTPTANSTNPVTSGGIKTAFDGTVKTSDNPYILNAGTAITASADLNSYTTAGTYTADSTVASSVTHAPTTTVGYKLVVDVTGTNTVKQTATTTEGKSYVRNGDNSSSSWVWSDWATDVTSLDYATASTGGVSKINTAYGINITNGQNGTELGFLATFRANSSGIKQGSDDFRPITPSVQHQSAFYGLAKAAGDSTQASSDNAVGTYTDGAKTAIKSMLGVENPVNVQINGVSIVNNDTANIPIAGYETLGVVSTNGTLGIGRLANGCLFTNQATDSQIKSPSSDDIYRPIVPAKQDKSVFYGLAKAAGDSTQAESSNAVGTYTLEAKTAIKTMLGVSEPTDVQIDGTSIVNNGVANIPIATLASYGVVMPLEYYGTTLVNGNEGTCLALAKPPSAQIKASSGNYRPIVPSIQHESVFYGLAKVAGDNTQSSSSNAVGTYTDSAKSAIQSMLDVPSNDNTYLLTIGEEEIPKNSDLNDYIDIGTYYCIYNSTITHAPNAYNYPFKLIVEELNRNDATTSKIIGQKIIYGSNPIAEYQRQGIVVGNQKMFGNWTIVTLTQVSELNNDSGFQTASDVSTAIASAIGGITQFSIEVVQELPQTGEVGVIYLVAHSHGTGDVYDEYIWTGSGYEKIGNTDVDLTNYVTNTDYAQNSIGGVVKISSDSGRGLTMRDTGELVISPASLTDVKSGSNYFKPIIPARQHASTFYGLATAAGDTTQSQSDNAVGTYTNDAKAAIRSMLGAVGNTDYASTSNPGIGKISEYYGVSIVPSGTTDSGIFCTSPASYTHIKGGTTPYKPITPEKQHAAAFYGLAKAAGDTTQAQSDNTVGTYTDSAKASINTMLGSVSLDSLDGAGISARTYTTLFGGQFSVTTADDVDWLKPHAKASVTGRIYKKYRYRVTFNGTEYILPGRLWYSIETYYSLSSIKVYEYIGDLGLYISDVSGVPEGVDNNIPFVIISDIDDNASIDVLTQTAGTYTILIERIDETKTILPKSLIYGDNYSPFEKHNLDSSTYNGLSIGVNDLHNKRATLAIGYGNKITNEFSIAIGNSNEITINNGKTFGDGCIADGSHMVAVGSQNQTSITPSEWQHDTQYKKGDFVKGKWNNIINVTAFCIKDHTSPSSGNFYHIVDGEDVWQLNNWANVDSLFVVGNGTLKSRSNALKVDWGGNGRFNGSVFVECNADSTGGNKLVSNVDYATSSTGGVVKVGAGLNMNDSTGQLYTSPASSGQIKAGIVEYNQLSPKRQHESTFYGLATAAGDSTQAASDNAVGTYTDGAKTAIRTMLGAIGSTDYASSSTGGVIKVSGNGLGITGGGVMYVSGATDEQIKAATTTYFPVTPGKQEKSVFYGLAKAAGDTSQASSSNTVGTYTDNAKSAIRTMLGAVGTTDYGTDTTPGLVKVNSNYGLIIDNDGLIRIRNEQPINYKLGSLATDNLFRAVSIGKQYMSVFYGLAEAAGDSTQSASDNAIGTYTNDAKNAIKSMLGVSEPTDVQVNGTSIVSNGVANIKTNTSYGTRWSNNGEIALDAASSNQIKEGTVFGKPLVPGYQHNATFYGLAKAAGDTTQSQSANAVGTYTNEAKAAIQSMLGVECATVTIDVSGTSPTITAQPNVRYKCGEVLSISITPPATGICDVIFESGSTVAVLTIPSTVILPDWFDATSLEANTIYEISIVDGTYGAVMTWSS